MVTIDCLKAINGERFLILLAEAILATFGTPEALGVIQAWQGNQPIILERGGPDPTSCPRLFWSQTSTEPWDIFNRLLSLPQFLAESLRCRVVIAFQNFPHLRSWDRKGLWQTYLQQEINRQTEVSYALIATVADRLLPSLAAALELTQTGLHPDILFLGPLPRFELEQWLQHYPLTPDAVTVFLDYVQGHMGDAIALLKQIELDQLAALTELTLAAPPRQIEPWQVHLSTLALVQNLAFTFESLILLLPPSQVQVLESLALDPTERPQSRDYIRKHGLARGGSLQGALASLEQKGLVYGSEYQYRLTSPFLACWLQQRLS
jgi:hypothetical protein